MDIGSKSVLDRIEAYLSTSTPALIFARLGAPIGASLSADVAAVKADTLASKLRGVADNTKVYPTLAAATTVAAAAGAFTLGAFVQIVPATTIVSDCYIDAVEIEAISAALKGELVLYHGAGQTEFARLAFVAAGRYTLSAQKKIPANDKIEAKFATTAGGSQTCDVRLSYHL